ncbi:putative thioesterase [Paenibacillus sp. 598K]|uniref:thioesterase II family protein n=1 Tax=Paenibacillus sp. 598K TaxID=1117987 RepID=UPI000FF9DA92|nr:alpha/beta fold hydrolase [Paenibacillus sp. 598K]GBF77729.1 putative thioesterase [Paenibacillus sp. 598K]
MDMLLFGLPYAGASASIYLRWRVPLQSDIEIVPVELAGRGSRIGEPFYADMAEAASDVAGRIKETLARHPDKPYALFGHSMGAKLAYETALLLCRSGLRAPVHLFLSGALPPHIPLERERPATEMSDADWRRELEQKGGTPVELLDDPQARELFLPILRADYTLLERYRPEPPAGELRMPMTVMTGRQEGLAASMDSWSAYSRGACQVVVCEGGHFFIHEDAETVLRIVRDTLIGLREADGSVAALKQDVSPTDHRQEDVRLSDGPASGSRRATGSMTTVVRPHDKGGDTR